MQTSSQENKSLKLGKVVHNFDPSPQKQRQADLCKFKTSLVYIAQDTRAT